jgi:hypothetical protein
VIVEPVLPVVAGLVAMVLPILADLVALLLPVLANLAPVPRGALIRAAFSAKTVAQILATILKRSLSGKLAGSRSPIAEPG